MIPNRESVQAAQGYFWAIKLVKEANEALNLAQSNADAARLKLSEKEEVLRRLQRNRKNKDLHVISDGVLVTVRASGEILATSNVNYSPDQIIIPQHD